MFKALFSLFQKRQRYLTRAQLPHDISQINSTFSSGRVYLQYWDDKLSTEQNIRTLREFSTELFFFLTAVTNKWMTKRKFAQLTPNHQNDLQNMVADLSEVLDEVQVSITRLERERQLSAELEKLVEPVLSSSPKSPNYSGWARTSFTHSHELLKAGQSLPLPSKEGGIS